MRLTVGYVPLTDAAPLVAAVEFGFAAEEGIDLVLSREPSWATLRDRLALGRLDAAHMLAPLALATHLGLSGPRAKLAAPLGLSLNGNAVTLSRALWAEVAARVADDPARGGEGVAEGVAEGAADGASPGEAPEGVGAVARALAAAARRRAGGLTLATVFPYSSHTHQLRRLFALGGADLDDVARVVVVPPPRAVEALERGLIDGFCVGAPWNSVAVAAGLGRIAAFGADIAPDALEKVLAFPADGAAPPHAEALVRAVRRAGAWCARTENVDVLADRLAAARYLDLDPELIRRGLAGRLCVDPDGRIWASRRFVVMGGEADVAPARADALVDEMAAAGQIADAGAVVAARDAARTLFAGLPPDDPGPGADDGRV